MSLKYIAEMRKYEKFLRGVNNCSLDYTYKAKILSSSLTNAIRKISLGNHLNLISDITGEYQYNTLSEQSLDYWIDSLAHRFGFCAILEADRINHATFERVRRLRLRVTSIISYPSLFLTLTFTNKVLRSTSKQTRRRYVSRFLRSISINYVANIDYGKKKGREHYHALVQVDSIDHTLWSYGAINFERVYNESTLDSERLSSYIAKLTNHAIKKTTKREHLIYPKKS